MCASRLTICSTAPSGSHAVCSESETIRRRCPAEAALGRCRRTHAECCPATDPDAATLSAWAADVVVIWQVGPQGAEVLSEARTHIPGKRREFGPDAADAASIRQET